MGFEFKKAVKKKKKGTDLFLTKKRQNVNE